MTNLYPFIDLEASEQIVASDEMPMYKELGWNFEKNQPLLVNGQFVIVEGNEAIKVWINKTILTERYEFPIYSWDYGCEIHELIGKSYTLKLVQMETERYIKEALLINPYILEVNVTNVNVVDSVLSAHIDVQTIYGEVEVDV